jgi:hypothetical protein
VTGTNTIVIDERNHIAHGKLGSGGNEMGLDIYHAQAKPEVDKRFCRVDMFLNELKPLQSFFQIHPNPHIDWEKMFADHGLVYRNYRVLSRSTDGRHNCFAFVDVGAVGFNHPVRVIFSDEWQLPFLPRFMRRSRLSRFPGSWKVPKHFGSFATIMKSETVIFYDLVGYHRNGVSNDFYHSFRPDDATCLKDRVERIHQMTVPEAREGFKRSFIDNWIDGRSFVIISY